MLSEFQFVQPKRSFAFTSNFFIAKVKQPSPQQNAETNAEDSDENKLVISDDEDLIPAEQVNNSDQSLRNFVEESKQEVFAYKVNELWIE